MTPPPTAIRGAWLLTRLRLRRLLNQTTARYNRSVGGRKGRPASPAKRRNPWLVTAFVATMMLFSAGNIARQAMLNLHGAVDAVGARVWTLPLLFSEPLTRALTMQLSLLVGVTFLLTLGAKELAQPDWDLEWLVTLPIRPRALLWSRIVERTVANPVGWFLLWPCCGLLAWYSGYRWTSPLVAMVCALPLMMLVAVARTLVDTGLRLRLAPARLRNLQAVASIGSILLLYFTMSAGMQMHAGLIFDFARVFPAGSSWAPTGLIVQGINAPSLPETAGLILLMLAEAGAGAYLGVRLLERQLRHGVVAASSRESSRRSAPPRESAVGSPFGIGSVVQRRELRLLSRDRTFLVQTLVLPLVVVGSQVMLNGRFNVTANAISPATTAAIAFGVAAYTLMASAFQTLNSEGAALWILYTVPRSLASILFEKAQLWAVLALIYPVAICSFGLAFAPHVGVEFVGLSAIALLGVPIYAGIAVALGVFASDPLAVQVQQKVRPTYVYLYMLLAGLYTYAIFASQWAQRLVLIVLSALLAMALGQKARDELPFLLDPAASPPARVSTSDGVIAAMLFFVFQGLIAVGLSAGGTKLDGSAVLLSYSIAGAVTYAALRYSLWRSKAVGVPRLLPVGASMLQAVRWGVGMGLIAAIAGLVYLWVSQRWLLPSDPHEAPKVALLGLRWVVPLAVIAAPLCEEFIFRGLIYGGMRRSIPEGWAIFGSAAVFAIVHPPMAMIPVFGLGMCAAVAYRRSGGLLAPMLTHALYNGAVIWAALLQL